MKALILLAGLFSVSLAHAEDVNVRGDASLDMKPEEYPAGIGRVRFGNAHFNGHEGGYLIVEFKPGVFGENPTCVFSVYPDRGDRNAGNCYLLEKPTLKEFIVQCSDDDSRDKKAPRNISFICTGEKP